ncbi:Orf y [Tanacetum coccineum]
MVNPEQQLAISGRRRAQLAPAEVLYSYHRQTARHRVYQALQREGMQHIHIGLAMIRLHTLHRIEAGTNALVVLQDTRWSNTPLTKREVLELVEEIAQQPKKVEEEALKLTAELERKANPDYIEAKQATEEIETPSIGFAAPFEFKEGTIKMLGALIKQNNTILYLLIKQGEEVRTIREELIEVKGRLKELEKQEATPQEFGEAIADLTKRLEKVGISEKTLPKSKQGPIYVNQDPSKIFATQFSKEKK